MRALSGHERPLRATAGRTDPSGDPVEFAYLGGGVTDHGQRVEVAGIGTARDIAVAEEVGDALAHGHPLGDQFAATVNRPPHPKAFRVVDDCLDPKDHASFVVHLDPVVLDAVLDAYRRDPPMGEFEQVGHYLALKLPDQLSSQEAHDLLGAKALGAVAHESGIQLSEHGMRKHQVGGVLALRGDPVVPVSIQEVTQQGIHGLSEALEDLRPVERGEAIGESLGTSTSLPMNMACG